ncbi:MAG: protein-export chaperone SecB [Alphaproteobacteria bacterium]|nr:protein-export chaperone SecB [Alphaproteobacteria bacterium]
MTDETDQPDETAPPETEFQARILSQYIRDLSFESPSIDRALDGPGQNPNLELEVNVNARSLRDNLFQSEIEFKAKAVDDGGTIYQMECSYGGVFRLERIPREALEPFLLVNCPSMLFPFLRRIIADLTREGGFPPLFLDPIDFGALYMNRKQKGNIGATNGQKPN